MGQTSAPVLFQRMRDTTVTGVGPDGPSVIGVYIASSVVVEGSAINAFIRRVGGRHDQEVAVAWTWTSTGGSSDLTAPLAGTTVIPANVLTVALDMATVNRAGTQGERNVRVTLSAPVNCTILDTNGFAQVAVQDRSVAVPIVGAYATSAVTATEGDTLSAKIERVSGDNTVTVDVDWLWKSDGGNADFASGAVLSGRATLNSTTSLVPLSVVTATRSGTQGDRAVTLELSAIMGGAISTDDPSADFTLKDYVTNPVVGIYAKSTADVVEGGSAVFQFKRTGGGTAAVSCNFAFTSSLGSYDFDDGEAKTGTVSLGIGVNSVDLSIKTRDRSAEAQGSRDITCTITNPTVGTIGTATATRTLVDHIPPVDSGLPKYQPAASVADKGKWHMVGRSAAQVPGCKAYYSAGRAGWAAAVAASNYVAGDIIVLWDGTYVGDPIVYKKSGTSEPDGSKHCMVRSYNHGKAKINLRIDLRGIGYTWHEGLDFIYEDTGGHTSYATYLYPIMMDTSGTWVTNCRCNGVPAFIRISSLAGPPENIKICYNEMKAVVPGAWDGSDPGGKAVGFATIVAYPITKSQYIARDSDLAWNLATLDSPNAQNGRAWFNAQDSKPEAGHTPPIGVTRTFRVHHNHVRGDYAALTYIKRSVIVEYNYFEWTSTKSVTDDLTSRHGIIEATGSYNTGAVYRGNRLKGVSSSKKVLIEMNGSGSTVNGNVCERGIGKIMLFAGTEPGETPEHDACDYAQIVENFGFSEIVMGFLWGGKSAGTENVAGRNGWPDNVRIYPGDSGWNPTVTRRVGADGRQCPRGNYEVMTDAYAPGDGVKITAITEAELTPYVGCDPMD